MPEEIRAYLKSIAGIAPDKTLWGVVGALARRVDDNIQAIKGQVQLSKDLMTRIDEVVAELKGVKDEIFRATGGRKSLGDVLSEIWNVKGDWWNELIRNVNAALDLGEGFLSNLRAKIESAKELALSASSRIEALIDDVPGFERVRGVVTCLADGIRTKAQDYLVDVREMWSQLKTSASTFRTATGTFVDKWRGSLQNLILHVESALSSVVDKIRSMMGDLRGSFEAVRTLITEGLKEGAKVFAVRHGVDKWTVTAHYQANLQLLPGTYYQVNIGPWSWSRAKELGTSDFAEFIKKWMPGYLKAVAGALHEIIKAVLSKVESALSEVATELTENLNSVKTSALNAAQSIKSTVSNFKIPDIPTKWFEDEGKPLIALGSYIQQCISGTSTGAAASAGGGSERQTSPGAGRYY